MDKSTRLMVMAKAAVNLVITSKYLNLAPPDPPAMFVVVTALANLPVGLERDELRSLCLGIEDESKPAAWHKHAPKVILLAKPTKGRKNPAVKGNHSNQ